METLELIEENVIEELENYQSPDIQYFKTRQEFDEAVGKDFIEYVNRGTKRAKKFLVGLSHGQSPAGAYQYIFDHFEKIKRPELVRFTFVNSPLKRQRDLKDVTDAITFLKKLVRKEYIQKDQILGSNVKREDIEGYAKEFVARLKTYLKKNEKDGLDYVFLATNPEGHVGGITRYSEAFDSKEIAVIVNDRKQKELTGTPYFLKKSRRIAFLATKADKRKALAALLYRHGKPNESPSFLRHIEDVENRMKVFIDDEALTWPQIEIQRKTKYGTSTIKVDVAKPYNENAKRKLPVIILIHGFLGLNSFDGLLTTMPTSKYIMAAMHYGSVPDKLPVERYSKHVVNNINAVVDFFGSRGHSVYIFDHSMGNLYFLMINRDFNRLEGIKKYLKGRIGANPFFGIESKHATLGFMDNVIMPSLSFMSNTLEKTLFIAMRRIIPIDTKKGVRNRGIRLTDFLISKDSKMRDRVWVAVKERILHLMTNMDSLPHLNRIPIERALNRLPAKIFVIQIYSALLESKTFDKHIGLSNMEKHDIPVLILKSEKDSIAKFVPRLYDDGITEVIDVTNYDERDLFREHLYHMVNPEATIKLIDDFIRKVEKESA